MRLRGIVALGVSLAVLLPALAARADRPDEPRGRGWGRDKSWAEIYDYQPRSGPPGTMVTITGRGFRPQMKVFYGGTKVNEESWDWATIRFYIPDNAGDGDITLRMPGTGDFDVGRFDVVEAMGGISGFSPEEGPPGTRVELWGRFMPGDEVRLNGQPLRVLDRGPARMVVEIPYGARDDVFVLTRPGSGGQAPSRDRFHVTAGAPFIVSMNPTSGRPGTTVALMGGGFGPDDRVFYGENDAQVVRVLADRIEAVVPLGARVSRRFFVRGPRGEAGSPAPFNLRLEAAIRDFSPVSGPPGTRVSIRGSGFLQGDVVMLGGRQLGIEQGGPDRLQVTIPDGAPSDYFVLVRGGQTVATSGRPFMVEAPSVPPLIGSFTPSSGPPGTQVILVGAGFTPDVRVAFGGQALPIVSRNGEHTLTVVVPRGATQSAPFVVANSRGETRSGAWFELQLAATVESLSPTSGPPLTMIAIRGNGFRGDESFFLGPQPLRTVERRPDGYVVQVPQNGVSGPVSYESFGQRVRTPFRFDVLANPVVRWFGPAFGPPGTQVTIRGERLEGTTRVYFGGLSCAIVSRSPTELLVAIPPAAQGGDYLWIEVGGQRVRTQMPFRVAMPQPVITNIMPGAGPVGTQVTIDGGPFAPSAQVYLGNVQCPIVSRQPNRIVVSVPPGIMGLAPFTVTDDTGARAVSDDMFNVQLPPGPGPDTGIGHHEHAHEHPHGDGGHHHHPHVHPHRPGTDHHHPY